MNIPADIIQQLLPKTPRLQPDGSGYDWREFDRWLQRVQALLGTQHNEQAYNIPAVLQGLEGGQLDAVFFTDNSLEIQLLRRMVEQVSQEVSMIPDYQQEIFNLRRQVNDLGVEIGVS